MADAYSSLDIIDDEKLATLPPLYNEAVKYIRKNIPGHLAKPLWGIVCGSGLSGLGDVIEEKVVVPYDNIPVRKTCPSKVQRSNADDFLHTGLRTVDRAWTSLGIGVWLSEVGRDKGANRGRSRSISHLRRSLC